MSQYLQFNPSRFWLLFVREVREQTLQWRLWILLSMVIAILGSIARSLQDEPYDMAYHLGVQFIIINIGGCIFTSSIFKEWHDSKTRYFRLTLPVSRLEVLLVKWFISGIGFSLAITGMYILMYGAGSGISGLFYPSGHQIVPITVLLLMWLKLLCNYLLLHAGFFFCSVVFTSYRVLKTLLVLSVFFLVLSGFLFVVILTSLVTFLPPEEIQLSFKLTFLEPVVYVSGFTQVSSTLPHDCANSGNITTRMVNVLDWFRWLLIPSVLVLTYHRFGKLED